MIVELVTSKGKVQLWKKDAANALENIVVFNVLIKI